MSIILHSQKPIDADQWLLDGESQQRFYDALVSFLCVEVARQCPGVERHQVAAFIKGKQGKRMKNRSTTGFVALYQ